MFQNRKLECADGSYVSPGQCCATGGCNIFCCNCAGHCKKKKSDPLDFLRLKRETDVEEEEAIAEEAERGEVRKAGTRTVYTVFYQHFAL